VILPSGEDLGMGNEDKRQNIFEITVPVEKCEKMSEGKGTQTLCFPWR
jgi:hypothetical protein